MLDYFPMHTRFIRILLMLILFVPLQTEAQTNRKIGLYTGAGTERLSDKLDLGFDYQYRVHFFQFEYSHTIISLHKTHLEGHFTPQFNTTRYRNLDGADYFQTSYEAGLNISLAVRQEIITNNFSVYIMLGTGPHYIFGSPDRQISGFIFSDNLFIGAQVRVWEKLWLDIRPGFRHISNAETRHPNLGINSFNINFGFFLEIE